MKGKSLTTAGDSRGTQPGRGEANPSEKLLWACSLKALLLQLQAAKDDDARNQTCGAVWLILTAALGRFAQSHAKHMGRLAREEIEDIASTKALYLLRRAGEGGWDITGRTPAELAGFLSTAARNGVIDRLKESRRWQPLPDEPGGVAAGGSPSPQDRAPDSESPDLVLQRREFAQALRRCALRLTARARRAWLFRVFYAMSSVEIGRHPEIGLRAAHVDVLLHRARHQIRSCMRKQGFTSQDMPPGTFVELWRAFRSMEA